MPDNDTEVLLNPGDLAERLDMSPSSAHRLMRSGSFETIDTAPTGSQRARLRVRVGVFNAWVASQTRTVQ